MKNKYPLNPNTEILRWGPINGRYYYVSDFIDSIFNFFPKKYAGFQWPDTLALFMGEKMLWLNEYPQLRKDGKKVFSHFVLNKKNRKSLYRKWLATRTKLQKFEKEIEKIDFKTLSDYQLANLGSRFYGILTDFWMCVTQPELGNYGSDYWLESELKNFIPDELQRKKAMETLTAPERPSFYQQEEIKGSYGI